MTTLIKATNLKSGLEEVVKQAEQTYRKAI